MLEAFSGLFLSFAVFDQKWQNFIKCDGLDFLFIKTNLKFVKNQAVILDRIFSESSFSENP
jgi:hypothetical protein